MRRFGERVRAGVRYRDRAGVYAILLSGARVLVTRAPGPPAEIQLPGGGIDPGESPLAALHREVREETGWRIAPCRRLGVFQRFAWLPDYGFWARKLCHVYLARPVRRLGPPSEPGHEALWMPAEEALRRLSVAGDRWFLGRLLAEGPGARMPAARLRPREGPQPAAPRPDGRPGPGRGRAARPARPGW
ncbi:MAG: NUDIX hydrolase [Paracoccaceae bacterium]|nr:MAG: NUDIX domain-containing protein [Alphaproteobacteria bacterium]GIX13800.1 MAG: NUDIX hydrolase [Paracoccaceae bacterium]